jgi:hypothetical protein
MLELAQTVASRSQVPAGQGPVADDSPYTIGSLGLLRHEPVTACYGSVQYDLQRSTFSEYAEGRDTGGFRVRSRVTLCEAALQDTAVY